MLVRRPSRMPLTGNEIGSPTSVILHYLSGSVVGPHPFPTTLETSRVSAGREMRAQNKLEKAQAAHATSLVGGGSNAIGAFHLYR
jgi:tryptophan synthase beta subunit